MDRDGESGAWDRTARYVRGMTIAMDRYRVRAGGGSLLMIAVLSACACCGLAGCAASGPASAADGTASLAQQRDAVVQQFGIRNSTGATIYDVLLEESPPRPGQGARLGGMSPVPPRSTQTFLRAAGNPALPKGAIVRWRDASGVAREGRVNFNDDALGLGNTLIVEITAQQRAKILCEDLVGR